MRARVENETQNEEPRMSGTPSPVFINEKF